MARRKLEKRNIRKLTKLGGRSIGVTIPIEIIRKFGWRERQKVVVKKSRKAYYYRGLGEVKINGTIYFAFYIFNN